jgi:hypothetical protein
MSDVQFVIKRIDGGARPMFFVDYFGRQWVELRGSILFWRRKKFQFASTQIEEIKAHLRSRQRAR